MWLSVFLEISFLSKVLATVVTSIWFLPLILPTIFCPRLGILFRFPFWANDKTYLVLCVTRCVSWDFLSEQRPCHNSHKYKVSAFDITYYVLPETWYASLGFLSGPMIKLTLFCVWLSVFLEIPFLSKGLATIVTSIWFLPLILPTMFCLRLGMFLKVSFLGQW